MATSGQTKNKDSFWKWKLWFPKISSRRRSRRSPPSRSATLLRLLLFGFISTLWFSLALLRLWDFQVLRVEHFLQKAKKQHEGVIEIRAARGDIYDRSGEKLAFSTPVDSIGVFPRRVPNPRLTASLLAEVLDEPEDTIYKKLTRARFQWIKRLAEPGETARIRSLRPAGIHFEKENRRSYPHGTIASHLLGAVGVDHTGQAGIEQFFEKTLQGRPGLRLVQFDAKRNYYASRVIDEPVPGADLFLTIDHRIQVLAERELGRAMTETQSVAGSIVVMDPSNGDLLAVANRPTFDPNQRVRESDELKLRHNYALSHLIEPGSSFKIVTIAAALEEKLATPDEILDCQMGGIYVGSRMVRDHKPFGDLSVSEILAKSSNVGTIKLGQRLQPERLYAYARNFGFGEKTGLPLPGETAGILRPLEQWTPASMGSIPIGQEIGVTTIQLARAVSVIANGGMLVKPALVRSIRHPDKLNELLPRATPKRVISPETAAKMRAMMEGVVQNGTGRLAHTQGYRVGGKTGTAQKVDAATGSYSNTSYLPNFVGFAPVNDPSIVIVVVLDSPVGQYYGGAVAAPLFPAVAMQALRFRDVPPELPVLSRSISNTEITEEVLMDFALLSVDSSEGPKMTMGTGNPEGNVVWITIPQASVSKQKMTTDRTPLGSPVPYKVFTGAGNTLPKTAITLNVASRVVPDFQGMTVRQTVALASKSDFDIDLKGTGFVQNQRPTAGSPAPPGQRIEVQFSNSRTATQGAR